MHNLNEHEQKILIRREGSFSVTRAELNPKTRSIFVQVIESFILKWPGMSMFLIGHWEMCCFWTFYLFGQMFYFGRYMAEIIPIRSKTINLLTVHKTHIQCRVFCLRALSFVVIYLRAVSSRGGLRMSSQTRGSRALTVTWVSKTLHWHT